MAAASHAALTSKNMSALLLTKPQLESVLPVLQALQEHRGPEFASTLLACCYVRIRKKGVPTLRRLLSLELRPEGQALLRIEGIPQPRPGNVLSQSNPFTNPDADEYKKTGRQELLQLQESCTAAGQVPGVEKMAAAGTAWRKKVLLGWAEHWQEFLAQRGIEALAAELQDVDKIAQEATYLEALPPGVQAAQQQAPSMQAVQQQAPGMQPAQQQVPGMQPAQQPAPQEQQAAPQPQQLQQALSHQHPAASVPQSQAMAQPAAMQPLVQQPQSQAMAQPAAMPMVQPQQMVPSAAQPPELPPGFGAQQEQQGQHELVPAPSGPQLQQHQLHFGQAGHQPQQPLQPAQLSMHASELQRAGSPDLPPHLQQQHSQPAMEHGAPQQPLLVQQPLFAAPQPPLVPQQAQQPQPAGLQHPHPYMQQLPAEQQHAVPPQLLQQPAQQQPALQKPPLQPAPLGWPGSREASSAEQLQQPVPMTRHPSFAAHHPALPPVCTTGGPPLRQQSMPHVQRGGGGPPLRQQSMPDVQRGGGAPVGAARAAFLPLSHSGPARVTDPGQLSPRGRMPQPPGGGLALSKLHVFFLPPAATHGEVATFFRASFPSVHFARVEEATGDLPRHAVVMFREIKERDDALETMNGCMFKGCRLAVQLSADPPQLQPQPQRQRSYCVYVAGLPPGSTDQSVADYFARRYRSVIGAAVQPPTSAQLSSGSVLSRRAFVRFGKEEERDAALQEVNGTVFEGQMLRVELPWSEQQKGHARGSPPGATAPLSPSAAAAAGPEAAAPPPAGPQFKLLVVNVGDAMPADELCAYFRERYPSVLSAALRDGHGSVTFGSDAERHRAKLEMDGHVLPGGRKIGTGLPAGTPAPPALHAPPAPPVQPALPAAPAAAAAPEVALASGAAQGDAHGTASPAACPTVAAAAGPDASGQPAGSAGMASAGLSAPEQPLASPGAAAAEAAAGAAGSTGSAVPAAAHARVSAATTAAAEPEAGVSVTVGSTLPSTAVAAAVPLPVVSLTGMPGSDVLVPTSAIAAGEGQPQLAAIPDGSSAGVYLTPSTAPSLGVAGVLLPAQQLAAAAATAAPASTGQQRQQDSGTCPSGLRQGSGQLQQQGSGTGPSGPKQGSAQQQQQQESGAGSHPLQGQVEPEQGRGQEQRSSGHKPGSDPPRRRSRSRSPRPCAGQQQRSRSPRRHKDHEQRRASPARRGRRDSPARRGRSRSRSRSRNRNRSKERRQRSPPRHVRSPLRRVRSPPRREGGHVREPERGSRQQKAERSPRRSSPRRRSPRRDSPRRRSRDRAERKRQHSSERGTGGRQRRSPERGTSKRQRTPEQAQHVSPQQRGSKEQQADAGQPAAEPAIDQRSPGAVTADSPGTRLVVVQRRRRDATPDVLQREATPDVLPTAAADASTPEREQPAAEDECPGSSSAGTPDLASLPDLGAAAWDAAEAAAQIAPWAHGQQQQQQAPEGGGGRIAEQPSSKVPLPPSPEAELSTSMDVSDPPPPPPPLPPSRPESAQAPPLLPPSRPGSAQPPLPEEARAPGSFMGAAAAAEGPGGGGDGSFAGSPGFACPPGFGVPSMGDAQGGQAAGWAADPDPLNAAGQPCHPDQPAPFLLPPGGPPLPPHLRRHEAPRVPSWVCSLFMDAARELAAVRRLPLDARDVEVRMDRLQGRSFCLGEAGVTIEEVCRLMEMRMLCELRRDRHRLLITALWR